MGSDIISIIKEAEAAGNKLYLQRVDESKLAVKKAQVQAKENAEAEKLKFGDQCQNRLDEATQKAKESIEQFVEENQLQCKALQDVADQNMQKSIDYILGRIVG